MRENENTVTLASLGPFDKKNLESVAKAIREELGMQVNIVEKRIDLSDYYDINRRQYDGNKLMKLVESEFANTPGKIVALFNVDLFIPILTFIFGQAYLGGKIAIASKFRLRNEHYGLKPNELLLQDRFIKEVIHELGHALGLIHCPTPECVMRSSTYVEDIDQKRQNFCKNCRRLLSEPETGKQD
ncbi:MAG: archaemetzincin family Zn-dependent metalloprotease [Bacteroidota bacterium]